MLGRINSELKATKTQVEMDMSRELEKLLAFNEKIKTQNDSEVKSAFMKVVDVITETLIKNKYMHRENDTLSLVLDKSICKLSLKEMQQLTDSMAAIMLAYEAVVVWPSTPESKNSTNTSIFQVENVALAGLAKQAENTYGSTKYRAIGKAMQVLGNAIYFASLGLAFLTILGIGTGIFALPSSVLGLIVAPGMVVGLTLVNLGNSFPRTVHSKLGRSMMSFHDALYDLAPKKPAVTQCGLFAHKISDFIASPFKTLTKKPTELKSFS